MVNCKKGHEFTPANTYISPDGKHRKCRICQSARLKKKYRENRKHVLNKRSEYRLKNKRALHEYQTKYIENNKEKLLILWKDYYHSNKERIQQYQKQYRKDNKERMLKMSANYKKKNPARCREYVRKRNALKRNQLGNFSCWMESYYRWQQKDTCIYCGGDISSNFHLEHMTPLAREGLHSWDNTCLSCPRCNLRKGTLTFEEFEVANNV